MTKTKREEDAILIYEKAIGIQSNFLAARMNLGILYYNAGRFDDAIKEFRTVLKHDPQNAKAISALRQMGEM